MIAPRSVDVGVSATAESSADHTMRAVVVGFAALAGVASLCGMAGWLTGSVALERIVPGWSRMQFTTAVCLSLLAVASFLPSVAAAACRAVAALGAGLAILGHLLSTDLGVDQIFFRDGNGGAAHLPSLLASACIAVLAASYLPRLAEHVAGELLAVGVLVVSFVALLAFLYDVDAVYHTRPYASVAVHTAVALLALSLARLAAPRRSGLRWVLTGREQAPTLLRSLLVLTFVAQPAIGWLTLRGNAAGWVSGPSTIVALTVLCMLSIATLGWFAALRLGRIDRQRRAAVRDLTALAADLERQVDDRVDQIHEGRAEIAVLEDRQRIAADLHDVVIQRLFAAGLTLQAGVMGPEEGRTARMETAAAEMDAAILELRASIFELHGRTMVAIPLSGAVEAVVHDAGRILGFAPTLEIDDPDDRGEAVRDDLVAVLREALANVARHAQASSVVVHLCGDDDAVRLTITDDGRGMTTTSHRSGTRNITRRAEVHGGDCRWVAVQPHGTQLIWTVPGPGRAAGRPVAI